MRKVSRIIHIVVGLGVVACGASYAATLNVSEMGVDGVACGPSETPCRTISQAITNAAAGDMISVGPGMYGSLNADADLSDPGEENSGMAGIVIHINKALTLTPAAGGESVVISGAGLSPTALVSIASNGVTFGKKGKGFDLQDSGGAIGVQVATGTSDVVVSGNSFASSGTNLVLDGTGNRVQNNTFRGALSILGSDHTIQANQWDSASVNTVAGSGHTLAKNRLANSASFSFQSSSSDVSVKQNEASGNGFEPFVIEGADHVFSKNTVTGRSAAAFFLTGTASNITLLANVARDNSFGFVFNAGSSFTVTGNIAAGNTNDGFTFLAPPTSIAMEKNLAIGNEGNGFYFSTPTQPIMIRNSAIRNRGYGININGAATLHQNNIFGNGNGVTSQCGLVQNGSTLADATDNFWGDPAGPSAVDPADNVCGNVGFVDATSPAAAEFTVKAPKPVPY